MTTATRKESAKTAGVPRTLMLIDGAWVESAKAGFLEVENPANRRVIGEVPRAGAEDVDRAVQSATRAFEQWKLVVPRERGKLLLKIADAMEAQSEALALLIATETGNALRTQSRPEANGAAEVFRYFGGLASELKGETVPLGEHVLSYTRREPIGVVGGIIPWNSPVH
ncbi:MAG: aldehyde dehydrogenase family protein, partial [Acidiferrobacterales bacterium]